MSSDLSIAMTRRTLLATLPLPAALAACAPAEVKTFPTLTAAIAAVQLLGTGYRSTGTWSLAQVLEHAAQSVEYSMTGFPQTKSPLFQSTLGSAAFAVFDARGAMSHSLAEPIPGAPRLGATLPSAIERLVEALKAFDTHPGPLHPHFAYGALGKAEYTRAHLMHLANHWTEIVKD